MGKKSLRRSMVVMLFAAIAWVMLVSVQARLMYFPSRYSADELAALRAAGLLEIHFEARQGAQLALYKQAAELHGGGLPEKVWLVFGGNGARAADYRDLAVGEGCGYLFIDYPGYGGCMGKASPRAIDANIKGAVKALAERMGVTEEALRGRLCAFGHSLGAAAALRAAVAFEMNEVVLVSPFTTMKEMARLTVGRVLSNALLHRYDNIKTLAALTAERPEVRVVIFHGERDQIVPVSMGQRLAGGAPANATFHPIEGADHNGIVSAHRAKILAAMAAAQVGRE